MTELDSPALDTVLGQIRDLENEVRKRIVGMEEEMRLTLISLYAGGHVLLEGVPGLAKTLFFKTLAEAANVKFRRISFAADLLPKDVIGIEHFDTTTGKVELVVKGPLHTNFLLTDELNRARTSSKGSVLEPMEEGQVTTELGGTYKLSPLFMVIATQNPVEEEGTFGLGRAERDRFLMKVPISYPQATDEKEIIRRFTSAEKLDAIDHVVNENSILSARASIRKNVYVDEAVIAKAQKIVDATRPERTSISTIRSLVEPGGGASPRAGIGIVVAARVNAVMQGRDHVEPDDLISVVTPILRHRIVFRPGEVHEEEAESRLNEVIEEVIHQVM